MKHEMKKLKKTPRYVTEEFHAERTKSPVPIGRSEVTDADIEYVQHILKEDRNFFSQTLADMLHEEWRDEIPYDDSSVVQHMYYLHHTQARRWTVKDYSSLPFIESFCDNPRVLREKCPLTSQIYAEKLLSTQDFLPFFSF